MLHIIFPYPIDSSSKAFHPIMKPGVSCAAQCSLRMQPDFQTINASQTIPQRKAATTATIAHSAALAFSPAALLVVS